MSRVLDVHVKTFAKKVELPASEGYCTGMNETARNADTIPAPALPKPESLAPESDPYAGDDEEPVTVRNPPQSGE